MKIRSLLQGIRTSSLSYGAQPPNPSAVVKLVIIAAILMIASVDIYIPASLIIQSEFDITDFMTKLTFLVSPLTSFLCCLPVGYYSDRQGRRHFYLMAMILFILGAALCASAPSIGFFFLGRFLLSSGAGALSVLSGAILADLFKGVSLAKYIGVYASLFPAIFTLAPILGGQILSHGNWRLIFIFLFISMGMVALYTWFRFPETRKKEDRQVKETQRILHQLQQVLRTPRVFRLALANSLTISIGGIFTINSPFLFMKAYAFSPSHFAILIAIPVIFQFSGALLYRFLVPIIGPQKGLQWGIYPCILLMLGICGFITKWIPEDPYLIVGALSLFSLGSSFIVSSSVTLLLDATTNNKGLINSVISLIRNGSLIIILPLASYFISDSATPIFITLFIIATIILFLIRTPRK